MSEKFPGQDELGVSNEKFPGQDEYQANNDTFPGQSELNREESEENPFDVNVDSVKIKVDNNNNNSQDSNKKVVDGHYLVKKK